jgi:hypothetical protein
MSFIRREIDRIRESLVVGGPRYEEMYAAQQALEWALEPMGFKAPSDMISSKDIPEGLGDYPEGTDLHSSSNSPGHRAV